MDTIRNTGHCTEYINYILGDILREFLDWMDKEGNLEYTNPPDYNWVQLFLEESNRVTKERPL